MNGIINRQGLQNNHQCLPDFHPELQMKKAKRRPEMPKLNNLWSSKREIEHKCNSQFPDVMFLVREFCTLKFIRWIKAIEQCEIEEGI